MVGLPWYAHQIKAYDDDTEHLTMLQHGAYRRLLDHYYKHAAPLPASVEQLHRVCRAIADDERAAIASVLGEFFHLESDGWHNNKADDELSRMVELSEKRRNAAKISHEKRVCKTSANAHTLNIEHISKSSLRSDLEATPTRRRVRKGIPEDFPLRADLDWAERYWLQHGRADLCSVLTEEVAKFRDHHSGKLTASADWPASWRTWVRNAIKWNNGGHNGRKSGQSAHEAFALGALAAAKDA